MTIPLFQMLSATSFQITLLSGQNWQKDLELYVLGAVFLASSVVWYALFRLKPSFYVLSFPWIFFGLAFFLIGLPSVHPALHGAHDPLSSAATWCYAAASAAGFAFFGLNFGEEAGAATEVWILRACIVQGTQQVWVAALWYWGDKLKGAAPGNITPWWIVTVVWPLSVMSFVFAYLMLYGLPDYYRQTPPKVPNFLKTLFRRKLVLWFLGSEILRDYWLSGVRFLLSLPPTMDTDGSEFPSHTEETGASCGVTEFPNGRSFCSLSLSSSGFGVYCWVFLHTSARLIRGCSRYLPSVLVRHGGVKYVSFI